MVITNADAAEALWRARSSLAAAPRDLAAAFPGVVACTPAEVRKGRRHPLRPGVGGQLLGCVFEHDGATWCVEELAAGGAGEGAAGLYAYDTARWASAALRLDERCKLFGRDVLEQLERVHVANERATADFLGGLHLGEGSLDELLRSEGGGSRPADALAPVLGRITVGRVGDEQRATSQGWRPVYIGRNADIRKRLPDGEGMGNPWVMLDDNDDDARAECCQLCAVVTRDPMHGNAPRGSARLRLTAGLVDERARRQRETTMEGLVRRVAAGENLALLCHCRGLGAATTARTMCHGDAIADELRRRAEALLGGGAGEEGGATGGGERRVATRRVLPPEPRVRLWPERADTATEQPLATGAAGGAATGVAAAIAQAEATARAAVAAAAAAQAARTAPPAPRQSPPAGWPPLAPWLPPPGMPPKLGPPPPPSPPLPPPPATAASASCAATAGEAATRAGAKDVAAAGETAAGRAAAGEATAGETTVPTAAAGAAGDAATGGRRKRGRREAFEDEEEQRMAAEGETTAVRAAAAGTRRRRVAFAEAPEVREVQRGPEGRKGADTGRSAMGARMREARREAGLPPGASLAQALGFWNAGPATAAAAAPAAPAAASAAAAATTEAATTAAAAAPPPPTAATAGATAAAAAAATPPPPPPSPPPAAAAATAAAAASATAARAPATAAASGGAEQRPAQGKNGKRKVTTDG